MTMRIYSTCLAICDVAFQYYVRLTRLGLILLTLQLNVQASAKLRLLKVELLLVADRDRMLLASKSLKNSHKAAIKTSEWLQRDEIEKIKVLR